MVKARERKNEKRCKQYHADSKLIDIYHNGSSALNPDEVSRAEELVRARDRKNEKRRTKRAAAKDEILRASAKPGLDSFEVDLSEVSDEEFLMELGDNIWDRDIEESLLRADLD